MRRSRILESAFHEPGFLWRPQGKAGERCEGIPRYVEQARRGLDAAGTQKDGSEDPVTMAERIPNTAVKLSRVESTGLEAAWEDRLLPVRDEAPVLYVRGLLLCEKKSL